MKKYYLSIIALSVVLFGFGCDSQGDTSAAEVGDADKYARIILITDGLKNFSSDLACIMGSEKMTPFFFPDTGISFQFKKISADENNQHFAPNYSAPGVTPTTEIEDVPRTLPQWGVYEIKVLLYGEPVYTTNTFKYSGERIVEVAHGDGWALFVSTEKDSVN